MGCSGWPGDCLDRGLRHRWAGHAGGPARACAASLVSGGLRRQRSARFGDLCRVQPGRCRNLDENDLCTIYESRPLVCRIYPVEINPHIPLRPENKDCPPEAWEQGPELIHGSLPVDPALLALVQASRQADRDDIAAKVAICEALGMTTSALKGNGFTAYLPEMTAFAGALAQASSVTGAEWMLHVEQPERVNELRARGCGPLLKRLSTMPSLGSR